MKQGHIINIIALATILSGCKFLPEVSEVRLSESSITLHVNQTRTITATVEPAAAEYDEITWSSSDPKTASVSNGKITANKIGTAEITASAGGVVSKPCVIVVEPTHVTGVSLDKSSMNLTEGESFTLTVTVSPSDATDQRVTLQSGDGRIATVSGNKVTAVSPGTTTITARSIDMDKTATCTVTVLPKEIKVTGVSLDKSTVTLVEKGTVQLNATVSPSDATNKDVTWSSNNTTVATVSSTGLVTAKSAGTATIIVKTNDGSKTADCTVTVSAASIPVTGVWISSSLFMKVGSTEKLQASIEPSNATNKSVTWSSSNTAVASVSSEGVVTAKRIGKAIITVKTVDGAKTATCSVQIDPSYIYADGLHLSIGQTDNMNNYSSGYSGWTSSNTAVATINSSGVITARSAGTTTIEGSKENGSIIIRCSVTVISSTVAVTGVSLNVGSVGMNVGGSWALTATVYPTNATNQGVTWSSNNTSVATVSSSGVVTAKAAGTATITVKTNDGGKTASCTVSVYAASISVTGISLDKSSMSLSVGNSDYLKPIIIPSNASNTGVTWTSSNTSVATVSSGVVTARAEGNAVITAKTNDGGYTANCSVTVTGSSSNVTLSFIPTVSINGMGGFAPNTLVFDPLKISGTQDSANESWVETGSEDTYTDPVVIQYSVSPSSISLDASYTYQFVYKDVTRTVSSDDFVLTPTFKSFSGGTLSLNVKVNGREAYGSHMTQFALKVKKNGVEYTSDYATLKTFRCSPFIYRLYSSIRDVWTSEIDPSTCDATVSYTSSLNLNSLVQVQKFFEESGRTETMNSSEMSSAGLYLVYEVVKNYKIGSPLEDQANFVVLSNGVLDPRSYSTSTSGNRTPIIRVKLMHSGDVVGVAYIKVCISFPSSEAVTGVTLDKTSLSLNAGTTATLSPTISPTNATNKSVTWTSDNTSVATVSSSGVVTANAPGSATITCTTADGGKKATCSVTVDPPAVKLSSSSITYTPLVPSSGETNPSKCQIIADINSPFGTWTSGSNAGKVKVNNIDHMVYYFSQRAMESITRIGSLNVRFRVSDDGETLYATLLNSSGSAITSEESVASIDNFSNKTTKLGVSAWNMFNYTKGGTVANSLLDTGRMLVHIGATAYLDYPDNTYVLQATFDGTDYFTAGIQKPLTVSYRARSSFKSGSEFGKEGSYIGLDYLLDPVDWRNRLFTSYPNFWGFYGPFDIHVDVSSAECDLNGMRQSLPSNIILTQVNPGATSVKDPVTGSTVSLPSNSYGFLTLKNNNASITSDFNIFIKVWGTHGFGSFESAWVTIPVAK